MRRILELLRFVKRTRNEDTEVCPPRPRKATYTAPADRRAAPRRGGTLEQAEAVAALKRARWQSTDPEAPEFGGLVEPSTAWQRGLMPEPYRPSAHCDPASGSAADGDVESEK